MKNYFAPNDFEWNSEFDRLSAQLGDKLSEWKAEIHNDQAINHKKMNHHTYGWIAIKCFMFKKCHSDVKFKN